MTLLQRFPNDFFAADTDRNKCLHATSSNALFCTHYIGNVIYHKFAHGEVSYRFNGVNGNVMLEVCVSEHAISNVLTVMTDEKSNKNVIFEIYFVSLIKFSQEETLFQFWFSDVHSQMSFVNICLKYITFRQILLDKISFF